MFLKNFFLRFDEEMAEIVYRSEVVLELLIDEAEVLVKLLDYRVFPLQGFFLQDVRLDSVSCT